MEVNKNRNSHSIQLLQENMMMLLLQEQRNRLFQEKKQQPATMTVIHTIKEIHKTIGIGIVQIEKKMEIKDVIMTTDKKETDGVTKIKKNFLREILTMTVDRQVEMLEIPHQRGYHGKKIVPLLLTKNEDVVTRPQKKEVRKIRINVTSMMVQMKTNQREVKIRKRKEIRRKPIRESVKIGKIKKRISIEKVMKKKRKKNLNLNQKM